jgi:hypothetical protein
MASPFASFTKDTIALPFDPPHTVTIQKVSGRGVEKAQQVAAAELVSGRGFAEKLKRLLLKDDKETEAFAADPLLGYDRYTLMREGITAWTYPDPPTPAAVADWGDDESEFIALAILNLTKPQLFADAETVRKND